MGGLVLGSSMLDMEEDMTGAVLGSSMTDMEDAMGGVVLGSSMTERVSGNSVALTINNGCNMKCPHCYLQQVAPYNVISTETIARMFALRPARVIVVGMEPLLNRDSMSIIAQLAKESKERGNQFAFMTNGLNLSKFVADFSYVLPLLHHIDVSLDAGTSNEYKLYRGGDLAGIVNGIQEALAMGVDVRVLNVINNRTCTAEHITNAVNVHRNIGTNFIMFSPFIATDREIEEGYSVFELGLENTIKAVHESKSFMADARAFLLIDQMHCMHEKVGMNVLKKLTQDLMMTGKVHFVEKTSDELGIIRITHDGYQMSSDDALHTARYSEKQVIL